MPLVRTSTIEGDLGECAEKGPVVVPTYSHGELVTLLITSIIICSHTCQHTPVIEYTHSFPIALLAFTSDRDHLYLAPHLSWFFKLLQRLRTTFFTPRSKPLTLISQHELNDVHLVSRIALLLRSCSHPTGADRVLPTSSQQAILCSRHGTVS